MSKALAFYSLDWERLQHIIGSRDRGILRATVDAIEPEFDEVFPDSAFGAGPDFAYGLDDLIMGRVLPGSVLTYLGHTLGFIALVKYFGRQLGDLTHTERSLNRFTACLDRAQGFLGIGFRLVDHLLWRPIVGYEGENDILWGGLNKRELECMAGPLGDDAPTCIDDLACDIWLGELWPILAEGLASRSDIISTYI